MIFNKFCVVISHSFKIRHGESDDVISHNCRVRVGVNGGVILIKVVE